MGGNKKRSTDKNNAHRLLTLNILNHLYNRNELNDKITIEAILTIFAPDRYSVNNSE